MDTCVSLNKCCTVCAFYIIHWCSHRWGVVVGIVYRVSQNVCSFRCNSFPICLNQELIYFSLPSIGLYNGRRRRSSRADKGRRAVGFRWSRPIRARGLPTGSTAYSGRARADPNSSTAVLWRGAYIKRTWKSRRRGRFQCHRQCKHFRRRWRRRGRDDGRY